MKVEYVTPFVSGAISVCEKVLSVTPSRGNLSARPNMFTTQQVNVVCGITGPVQGQVIYGMSVQTADLIAGKMLGQPIKTFDALAASAIAELGNMVCGTALNNLSLAGFVCDITPPTIIRGNNVRMCTADVPTLVVPLNLGEIGVLEINLSLAERNRMRVA